MKFFKTSNLYYLNKSTYINLRWIAYIGQLTAVLIVQFILQYEFNYFACLLVIFFSILNNLILKYKVYENQLNNVNSTLNLVFDILQLGLLLYFTGGVTNPFTFLIIIPSVFSSQYLNIYSSILLVILTIVTLLLLTIFHDQLPQPDIGHFHVPEFYLFSIPLAIYIGLIFLVYFGAQFGKESRIRKEANEKMQEIMAKENELISLGGQAAAAAHSLGTPLSTILLTAKELKKEFGENKKIVNDLNLLVSQSNRCSKILKKLSLNPSIEDEFFDSQVSIDNYIYEIVRSFEEISEKSFIINSKDFKNSIKTYKSSEIIYGLRNFIGNANKFSKEKVEITLISNKEETKVHIQDDGPGFPKDLIDKHRLGEPYIRSADQSNISKYGLGLGTFIGKALLEKNFANIIFKNINHAGGAEVIIKWKNKSLIKI
tara:strand:- start:744 stop:2030 length:1287 start_codon:yes stop_codon:yes gene_type:complete